jgi:Ca-activated chloride channel homolog
MLTIVRAALILIGVAVFGSARIHTQQSSARPGPDLVVLNVTVTDPAGRFVSDLSAADFQVREDGHPQQVVLFMPGTAPLSLLLLVDSSSSMDEEMSYVQQSLEEFVHQLRPQDSAELIDFDLRPKVLQPSTRDRNLLAAAVKRLRGGGSTSLYNALYITLRQLPEITSAMPGDPRRRVVVLLSDGEDTSSLVALDTLIDVATRSQATIYAIGLHAPEGGEITLRQLTSQTGGRFFTSRRAADVRRSYAQIAQELASQYLLGYVPSNRSSNDQWREVVVEAGRPNLDVRTRPGYRMGTTASQRQAGR